MHGALSCLDESGFESMKSLQTLQTSIYFDISRKTMTISDRVKFHNHLFFIRSPYTLKKAVERTCQELALAGFKKAVLDRGRITAELVWKNFLETMGIWQKICSHVENFSKIADDPQKSNEAILKTLFCLEFDLARDWELLHQRQ